MVLQEDELSTWSHDIKDFSDYTTIKCWSVLQFFRLKGKTSVLKADNLEPIPDLKYLLFSPLEEKYYLRTYKGYDLDTLFFYRPTLTFSGEDIGVENIRRYISDGNIILLFTKENIDQTNEMLKRVWKNIISGEGQMSYRIYISLLEYYLRLEDYHIYGKELTGYKTVCKQLQGNINELIKTAANQPIKKA